MKTIRTFFCVTLLLFAASSMADSITYTVDNISGDTWQYNYTIDNSAGSFDIEEFTIYFDFDLFENLVVVASPADWDPFVIQTDPGIPDDGFFDALFLAVPLAVGDMLGGFSVQFDFLGMGTPGSQFFEIVDPNTFDVLAEGLTMAQDVVPVPEPTTAVLVATGLLLIGCFSRRRRKLPFRPGNH